MELGLRSGQVSVLSRGASGLTPSATTCCGRRPENHSTRGEKSGSPAGVWSRQLRSTRGAVVHKKKNFLVVQAVVSLLSASSCRPAGGPVAWYRCPVLLSGLVVWPCRLVFVLRARIFPFFSKEATTQGTDPRTRLSEGRRPKDTIFSEVPDFYAWHDSGTGRGCWVLTLAFTSSFCRLPYLRSSVQTHRWGPVEEPPV